MDGPDATGARHAVVQGASRGIGLALVRRLAESGDYARVVATARDPERSPELQELRARHPDTLGVEALDVSREDSVAAAAARVAAQLPRLHLLVNCAGVLHRGDELQPEKRVEAVDAEALRRVFEVNAFGPLLVAKHFHPLLSHGDRAVLANLSARVGSIGDNRLGGWYAYRASKAAQNMFTRTLAVELGRRAPHVICVALHPGTVDTELSRPFQRGLPPERLFDPDRAARQLLAVIRDLAPEQSGSFLAWDGSTIPW